MTNAYCMLSGYDKEGIQPSRPGLRTAVGRFSLRSRRNEKNLANSKEGFFSTGAGAEAQWRSTGGASPLRLPSARATQKGTLSTGRTKAAFISQRLILSIGNPRARGHFADNSGGKSDKDRIGDILRPGMKEGMKEWLFIKCQQTCHLTPKK